MAAAPTALPPARRLEVTRVVSTATGDLLPVTILTGFLGAGKTTLLAGLLRRPEFARTAVIINEFGAVGLDHDLVRANTEARVVLLESGCVCCSLRSDLTDTLRDLFRQRVLLKIPEFERVIVETTGLADPVPILTALQADPVTAARFRFDGVVTVVDAVNGDAQMDVHAEAVRQIAMADRLILSKTDLASAEATDRLIARLAVVNPGIAPILTTLGGVTPEILLGAGVEPLVRAVAEDPDAGRDQHHDHDHGVATFTLYYPGSLPWSRIDDAFDALLGVHGDRILRVKGLLAVDGEPLPVVVQRVGHSLYPLSVLPAWPAGARSGRLVFITQGLTRAEVESSLAAYLA